MTWKATLDADALREIFDRDIAPTLDTSGPPTLHPTLIFVGAQPGAGKSRSIADVQNDVADATPVIGDDFRAFHPDYWALMRATPLLMPDITAQASGAWVGMAAEHLRQQRRSVILETTMRQHGVVDATARSFRDAGYRIEVRALAVPAAVSLLGTVSRFLGTGAGLNRWTPTRAHDVAYEAMPDTVARLAATHTVDRITVLTRTQQVLFDQELTPASAATIADQARMAIIEGRKPSHMTAREGREWVRACGAAGRSVAGMSDASPDLKATVRRLARDSRPIILATFPRAERVRALAYVDAATTLTRRGPDPNTGPVTGPTPPTPSAGPTLY